MSFDANVSALLTGWMGMNKARYMSMQQHGSFGDCVSVQVCYQPVSFPYVHTLQWFLMLWLATLPLVLVDKVSIYSCSHRDFAALRRCVTDAAQVLYHSCDATGFGSLDGD